jgi:hypothetical protein
MYVGGQCHASAALRPGKRPGTNCAGGWVGPRSSLGGHEKISPLPGFDPQTIQHVVSYCTSHTVSAHASKATLQVIN